MDLPASTHGELPGIRPTNASQRKSRVALACKRCKRRKQRCNGSHPVCDSCRRAGTSCIYERTVRPQYPGGKTLYINALEERIAFLEARLPAYAEDHFEPVPGEPEMVEDDISATTRERAHVNEASSHHGSLSGDVDEGEGTSIVDGVAYLSLCASGTADAIPDPVYLGSSSGATIARMIQSSIFRSSGRHTIRQGLDTSKSRPSSAYQHLSPEAQTEVAEEYFEFPFPDQARLLFNTYFDRLHTRWPLLDRKVYTTLLDRQYSQGALSIMHRSIMHLIYAIAARFLQLTRNPCGVDPEKHLIAAIEPMDYILEQHNLGTVQFLLLLALHGQRSPYGAGAWSQVRYAVSLCIELGLHRERRLPSAHHDPRDLEIRRRAFWCCYCLDRSTSIVLGRAFAISDRDINVQTPSLNIEFWDLTHKDAPDTVKPRPWSNIEPFIHVIKLERIQSRTQQTVFRVDKDVLSDSHSERAKLDRKMADIRHDLDKWLETVPHPPKDAQKISWMYDPENSNQDSQEFFNLCYHKAVLSLFTVLLPTLDPSDPRFTVSARSAASVCIAYKRLNQQKTLSYTMISLHSCFVAGLTLIYCLWRDRNLFGYDIIEAAQACSQSLTIFGEKWSGAVKYRDIFDALSGSLFKKLVHPSSSAGALSFGLETSSRKDKTGSGTDSQKKNAENCHVDTDTAHEPTMSEMISEAVGEAFMEVDEEAPGGWQGWRMWTEMLGEGPGTVIHENYNEWGADTKDVRGYDAMEATEWDFGGIDGLQ